MRHRLNRLLLLAVFCLALPAAQVAVAAEVAGVAGVAFAASQHVAGEELQLNGAGLRTRLFFKVYAAGLYVRHKSGDPQSLLADGESWRMRVHLLREVAGETLLKALREGLEANLAAGEQASLAASIEQFSAILRGIPSARAGDELMLDFANDKVLVSYNGEGRGVVANPHFGRALLSIWLGAHPVDADLKQALLGG